MYSGQLPPDSSVRQRADVLPVQQRENATLNAQLLDVKVKNHPDGIHVVLELSVRFTVRNNLKRTLFVIPEALKIVGIRLAETSDTRSEPYLLERVRLPSFEQPELLRITDHRSTEVKPVLPGGQWELKTDFQLNLNRHEKQSSPPTVIRRHADSVEVAYEVREAGLEGLRKLDAVWCQFEIRFWPHNMEEEGNHLQNRWAKHGSLLRRSLTSSPVRLNLKK